MRKEIVVIMVEPKYGLNIGYVARTMKNFGVTKLYIIGRSALPKTAFRFSSHARDILEKAVLAKDLRTAVKKFDLVIGTTARIASRSANIVRKAMTPEEALRYLDKFNKVAIVLGRDTTGLKNEELALCDIVVTIPTGTTYSTLNISHALAILLYIFTKKKNEAKKDIGPSRREREQLINYIDLLMEKIGFPEHRRLRVMKTFNKISMLSELNKEDMTTILGFFRRILINLQKEDQ